MIVALAILLWVLGTAGLFLLGWDTQAAPWRIIGAGVAGLGVVAAMTVGRSRLRPEANVLALLASLAIMVFLPPPVTTSAGIGIVVAAAAVLAAYYTLQLSLRTHAVAGLVLQHGLMRIAGTVSVAAVVAVLAVGGLRLGNRAVSARWQQSLDVGSGQFLVAISVLLMAVITALSMIAVSRTHADVGQEADEPGEAP